MYYAKIKRCDIADGPGIRTSLFVSGCSRHCDGCHNRQAWDYHYGQPFTDKVADQIIDQCRPYYVTGLTLLGGEPFEHDHELAEFVRRFRQELPGKSVWCYTGYLWEQIQDTQLIRLIDVLVDGPFEKDKHSVTLVFKGSSNQRIIDVKKSIAAGLPMRYWL